MPDRPSTPRRRECAWCGDPGRWPDRCTEAADRFCAEIIPAKCADGDHRRCRPETCAFAAEVHPGAIAIGVAAAVAAGHRWAVVSVLEADEPAVIGTGDHLGRVKSLIRTGHIKRCGYAADPLTKGLVMVVGRDGWLY